ncbi:MAG TPA: hypothetical protein ENH15_02435, partial [Actinobacteria bacterium]|nr:hypothetical protein [Actinomycetota bacterium]
MGRVVIAVMRQRLTRPEVAISIVVLFVFAVAQPLLGLLGRNAEFFLARASPALDLVLMALILALVVPLAIGLVLLGIRELHEPTGRVIHWVVSSLLAAMLSIQVIKRTPLRTSDDSIQIALAIVLGTIITAAIYRSQGFRSVMKIGAIAPVLALGLFVFFSPASQLIFRSASISEPTGITVGNPAPVVFVIFDEMPLLSLIDGEGNLEDEVYPNFARLAADATWYRNAVTVQQQSVESIPVILTGNDAPSDRLPMASDYPGNLFTLLSDNYEIRAVEAVTELCPEFACENRSRPQLPFGQRWRSLISDLAIVYGHLIAPSGIRAGLPPIDQSWSNFGAGASDADGEDFDVIARFNAAVDADRRIPYQEFIDNLAPPVDEPTLDFIHVMVPHIPWQYVSTGQRFFSTSPIPGSATTGWGGDEWLVNQAQQRMLLQVQYVDTLVGRLIDRLKEIGTYDDALIVVAADHGVIVRPDIVHRRVALEDTVGEIAAIPLFVKLPNQQDGTVDDYRAETLDILPTLIDALGIASPWETQGSSLLAADRPVRTESQITGAEGVVTFGTDGSEKLVIAARKIEAFGTDGPFGLTPPGRRDLLGLSVDELQLETPPDIEATLERPERYLSVDPSADRLPLLVSGKLVAGAPFPGESVVAIGINGNIVAVTRTYDTTAR